MRSRPLASSLFLILASAAFAQPCIVPPSCIVNSELEAEPGADMNTGEPYDVDGWFVSHGTPAIVPDDSPSILNGSSIFMSAADGQGEGIFTCYDLQPGIEYRLCLWVRNMTPTDGGGRLQIWMANGLVPDFDPNAIPPGSLADAALIDNSWVNSPEWTPLSFTFTPANVYTQVLVYPHMDGPPVDGLAYEVEVDDLRVTPVIPPLFEITVTASAPEVAWCDSIDLFATGAPPGMLIAWWPPDDLVEPVSDHIRVAPCATMDYSATAQVPDMCANICDGVLSWATTSYTVDVRPPTVPLFASRPVICGTDQWLYAEVPEDLCASSYRWVDRDGFIVENDSLLITDLAFEDLVNYRFELVHPTGECVAANNTITPEAEGTVEWFWMPNAFSPNADGINDRFLGYTRGFAEFDLGAEETRGFAEYDLSIFDRMGAMVHNTTDPDEGWDGLLDGAPAPVGVYAYVVDFVLDCSKESSERRTGHVTLVR